MKSKSSNLFVTTGTDELLKVPDVKILASPILEGLKRHAKVWLVVPQSFQQMQSSTFTLQSCLVSAKSWSAFPCVKSWHKLWLSHHQLQMDVLFESFCSTGCVTNLDVVQDQRGQKKCRSVWNCEVVHI